MHTPTVQVATAERTRKGPHRTDQTQAQAVQGCSLLYYVNCTVMNTAMPPNKEVFRFLPFPAKGPSDHQSKASHSSEILRPSQRLPDDP